MLEGTWRPVPMVSRTIRNAGFIGGEGGQWPQAIALSMSEPQFLMYGTDVGGLYRSTDGGLTWQHANIGYTPRGTAGIAIDPMCANRVLSVGANSGAQDWNGLYLSTDRGISWRSVLPASLCGYRDFRDQLAYDPSTYDAAQGYTLTVYWSRLALENSGCRGDVAVQPAIYKSIDGGETWTEIQGSAAFAGGFIRVGPSGVVYAGNRSGCFFSTDGGITFQQAVGMSNEVTGLDVGPANEVYLSQSDGLYVSRDCGFHFAKINSSTYPTKRPYNLKVSPANPLHMVIASDQGANHHKRYYSLDGGCTWAQSRYEHACSWIPYNNRQAVFAWHPTNAKVAWSFGGDWITKSSDSGAVWKWANDGNSGIMTGGLFHFNTHDDNLIYFGSQDYDGALSTDGGCTWSNTRLAGESWGGWVYGAYATYDDHHHLIYYGGVPTPSYTSPKSLFITFDSGAHVQNTGIVLSGVPTSYGDPTARHILFAWNQRSKDFGLSWCTMTNCVGVFTHNPAGTYELYGTNGNGLVVSADRGETWLTLVECRNAILDVAYDHVLDRAYIVTSQNRLYQYDRFTAALTELTSRLVPDQLGKYKVVSVTVDPIYPNIVYTAGPGNTYSTNASVQRSVDCGRTWTNLTPTAKNKRFAVDPSTGAGDGAREAIAIRVKPDTREAYVGTGCFGFWKIANPENG